MTVAVVPFLDLSLNLLKAAGFPLLLKLRIPASCPLPAAGRQKNLQRRIREDARTDIPSVHDHIFMFCEFPLEIQELLPHYRLRCCHRGLVRHLLCPNSSADIHSVQEHLLHTVLISNPDLDLAQSLLQRILILYIHLVLQHIKRDGAVHCPCVDIHKAQLLRCTPRNRALSRSCRSVNCNRKTHDSSLAQPVLTPSLYWH